MWKFWIPVVFILFYLVQKYPKQRNYVFLSIASFVSLILSFFIHNFIIQIIAFIIVTVILYLSYNFSPNKVDKSKRNKNRPKYYK
ncbi:MAG: hypothetical protein LBR40_01135 [Bacilli bacterium]|jgi:membrane protein implicated in regulation of membrane protease activity|nr:hypothetical protein [Bacilli bacterium]